MIDSQLYAILRDGLDKMRLRISCGADSLEHINRVLHQILLDNPQFCHFEGDWTWESGVAPVYTLNAFQREQLENCIFHLLREMQLPAGASALEKVKILYCWLAENIAYDRNAPHHQSAYGALVERRAVCKGIAKAYQLLLQRLDIPCELVEGSLDGSTKHVWIRFFANGNWFHSDVTMAYPQFRRIVGSEDFFAVTREQICRTHMIWDEPQQLKSFFQSLEKQYACPPRPTPATPASLHRFLSGDGVFLAAGSVSEVYLFENAALKRIPCGEDPGKLYYAMRECAMLQRLQNCRQVAHLQAWDVIREQDGYTVYLVLQESLPLDEYCKKHPLSTSQAANLIRSACDALQECYFCGVAHLDIQPGNFLVTMFGTTLKLTDFSSAAAVEELPQLDAVRGTPAYIAPEVYQKRAYSQCADVYSLGIILYCMLHQGKLPFGDQYPAHEAVALRMKGWPVKVTADIPEALRRCLEKACSYEPQDRYPDLRSFADALKEATNTSAPVPPMPPSPHKGFDQETPKSKKESNTDSNSFALPQPPPRNHSALSFVADTFGETTVLQPPSAPSYVENPARTSTAPLSPEAPAKARIDKVQFSAVAPKKALKGEYTLVQLYMYEEALRFIVEEVLQTSEFAMQEKRSGFHQVQENTRVKVVLTSRDIDITDNVLEETWNGGYLCFDFALDIPQDFEKRQILLTAMVYFNDVPATRLMMTLQLQTQQEKRLELLRSDVLSAFVSYASQDRARVAGLIQGMKKARPDMDIFFDINNLRSGENWEQTLRSEIEGRDILFLCWSQHAKESCWVDMEWRCALASKGLDSIEPIPIDPPDICPPPPELQSKHFNDSLLYIINK